MKGDNACCTYLIIIDCADSNEHSHIACQGSLDDSPGIDNEMATKWCLDDYLHCPLRPKGEG